MKESFCAQWIHCSKVIHNTPHVKAVVIMCVYHSQIGQTILAHRAAQIALHDAQLRNGTLACARCYRQGCQNPHQLLNLRVHDPWDVSKQEQLLQIAGQCAGCVWYALAACNSLPIVMIKH